MTPHDPAQARTDAAYHSVRVQSTNRTKAHRSGSDHTSDPGRRIGPDSPEGQAIAAALGVAWSPDAHGGVEELEPTERDYTAPLLDARTWAAQGRERGYRRGV